jgi:hypothetical protein
VPGENGQRWVVFLENKEMSTVDFAFSPYGKLYTIPEVPERPREVLRRQWYALVAFIVPFLSDVFVGVAVFGAFALFGWILGFARAWGFLRPEHLDAYERTHFWINYSLFWILGLGLLLRAVRRIFRGE